MKKILCVFLLSMVSYSIFAQKNKYEFRDLVFQCFEKLDDGKSDIEVKKWLKANFKVVENSEYYVIEGLPYGFNTKVYFHSTELVFEQENVGSFEDLDNINRAIASAINAFKMFGYLDVVNYDYKIYDVHRKKTWRMTTDLNPYQGIAWLTIKGDVKIYKSKEQIAKEKKEAEKKTRRLEEENIHKENKKIIEQFVHDSLLTKSIYYDFKRDSSLFLEYLRMYEENRQPMVKWMTYPVEAVEYPKNERNITIKVLYYYDATIKKSVCVCIEDNVVRGSEKLMERYKSIVTGQLGIEWCTDSNGIFYYRKCKQVSRIDAKLVYFKKKDKKISHEGIINDDTDKWLKENCKQNGKYFIRIINNNGLLLIQDVTNKSESDVFNRFRSIYISGIKEAVKRE